MTLLNYLPGQSSPLFPRAPLRWAPPQSAAGVQWRLPDEGKVRARKLLSRAATRPVYRFTSLKMGRSIHLESALEHQVAMLLDACPTVDAFGEQPVTIEFDTGRGMAKHIPDLALTHRGQPWFLELKYSKDVDQACLDRTRRLTELLMPLGIGYRLVTEKDLPQQPRLSNAWVLLQRGRRTVPSHLSLMIYQRVLQSPGITLRELEWASPMTAAALARDLLQGGLYADLGEKISEKTAIWTSPVQGGWLWA